MDQFFDLHQVSTLQNVIISSLYVDHDQSVWHQWICDCKHESIVSWIVFTNELITHYGDIKRNTFFIQLINIKKRAQVI